MSTGVTLTQDSLTDTELFAGLPPDALAAVAAVGRARSWHKDQCLFTQGQADVRAHVVLSGSIRISQGGGDGGMVIVRFIGSGELFGAVPLFTGGTYPGEATAATDCLEASWSDADIHTLIGKYPAIAINMVRIIGRRLQETQERVRELATQRAEQRVANAVLRLARQAGYAVLGGTAIEFPLRRKDVADISGTTLHTASRILTAWERAGWLTSHNQKLTLIRPQEIVHIGEDLPG